MRVVVVSPHPDDAVWSCGGVLATWADDGHDVTVVTVFDGDPPRALAAELLTVRARRAEDRAAVEQCGATLVGLGRVDARYRGHASLYPTALARRRGPHPEDTETVENIADLLAPRLDGADLVAVPAARRTHVDHALVRDAAHLATASGSDLLQYDEFPYGGPLPDGEPLAIPVDFGRWTEAGLQYGTEVQAMFGNPDRFVQALHRFATGNHDQVGATGAQVGGTVTTRLWR